MNVLALILAGGRVDDLSVLTLYRPKSIMPFGGLYRIIDFPMSNLTHSGIEKVGIFSQYRPFHLMEHIGNGSPWDMAGRDRFALILPPFKIHQASDWYQGTADAVYQNLDFVRYAKPDVVLILSGDHVYSMDYREIISFHVEHEADLTVAFTKVPRKGAHRYGLGTVKEENERGGPLLDYVEKPDHPASNLASITVYVFRPEPLFEALEANAQRSSHEFGHDIIPEMLTTSRVYGYIHRGFWGYTRTPEEYWQANMDLISAPPRIDLKRWKVMTNLAHRGIRDRQPALVGPSALIKNSLIYSGCTINGRVINSVISPGVTVEEGALVEDSVVFFDTTVKRGARVCRSVVDVEVLIDEGAAIGEAGAEGLALVGRGTHIPEAVTISRGVTVFPNLTEESFTRSLYGCGEVVQ
jgi:glucose-1-phosphate adenylyltransferase